MPFSRALVLCAWFESRRHDSQAFILRFKSFRPSNGQEYGASRKNAIQGKIQAQAAQKNHCTLTIIYIGAML